MKNIIKYIPKSKFICYNIKKLECNMKTDAKFPKEYKYEVLMYAKENGIKKVL